MTSVSAPLAKLAEVAAPAVPPADLDDLYARLLLRNRHYVPARTLYQKNVYRWKNWKSPTSDSAR